MNHVQSSLIAAAIGATFGVIGVASMFLYQKVLERKKYKMGNTNLDAVNQRISELENELRQLRIQQNQQKKKRRNVARKHVSNDSTYTATANDTDLDAFSTAGTDIGDDEFFDCSDSEDTLENDIRTREAMNQLDSVLSEIDRGTILEELLERDIYNQLQRLLDSHPNNVDVIWRFARACYNYSATINETEMKERIICEGIAPCQNFLENVTSPENADFHRWYAVLVGLYCDYLPMNQKIEYAYKFRDHVIKALELRPDDSILHHLIGRFQYEMSSLSWIQRKLAATVYSEPPNSTYEDAISSFERAEELATTQHLENRLFLAKAYIALSQYPKAVYWLNRINEPLAVTEEDRKIQAEAKELLEKYA